MPLFPKQESSSIGELPEKVRVFMIALWSRTSRRMRLAGSIFFFFIFSTWLSLQLLPMPKVSLEYDKSTGPYNPTKVALLIENRPDPILAPLMLHFISVVPPDWRFRFMGSPESVEHINKSMAIREQVNLGKLDLTYIPSNMSTAGQEMISRFLTTRWLYETVLQPAENLLIFQTDSILCANNKHNLNDYLEYDWIGAPWDPNGQYGGNGGLSLRRVSAIVDVLRNQERAEGSEPEDVWLSMRLAVRPGARMANGTISSTFSGEMNSGRKEEIKENGDSGKYTDSLEAARNGEHVKAIDGWRDGFYEPMGYHTGGSGTTLHGPIWGSPEKRAHIWNYCPEMKLTLKMDAAKYVLGQCNANWKRGLDVEMPEGLVTDGWRESEYTWGTETIDGIDYPLLPPNLAMW